jgi:uncharacterized membrane protein
LAQNEGNPLYDQLLAIQENAAQIVEQAEESFCASIGFIAWDELTEQERLQIHEWHRSLQKARTCIRNPDDDE